MKEKIIQKDCKKHGTTDFFLSSEGRYRCKRCNIECVKRRRKNVKILAVEYKGGCCSSCGYNKCLSALEFHHLDPNEKDFSLSVTGHTRSWKSVKAELDKCILVCSNCHREIHESLLSPISSLDIPTMILEVQKLKKSEIKKNKICEHCSSAFIIGTGKKYCSPQCSSLSQRKVKNRPSREELLELAKTTPICEIGRKYGVSDNAIRKWIKK
jgi:hypothetical protein